MFYYYQIQSLTYCMFNFHFSKPYSAHSRKQYHLPGVCMRCIYVSLCVTILYIWPLEGLITTHSS